MKGVKLLALLCACVIHAQSQTATPGCRSKLDIVFLLDSSASEGSTNFNKQLTFVENFVKQFQVGPDAAQFSVVTFSTSTVNEFNLDDHLTQSSVVNAVQNINYHSGATYTDKALTYVASNSFLPKNGGRPDAEQVVIVLTDGQSTSPSKTQTAALQLHSNGVEVIAIGIGSSAANAEIQYIASDAKHVFEVQDFNLLNTIQTQLTNAACLKPTQGCKNKQADIVFALDSSSSIASSDFQKQLVFIKNVIRQFDVSPNETQFSVVSFSSSVDEEFPLNQYLTKTKVLGAVTNIRHHLGTTHTDEALSFIRNTSFTLAKGGRPGIQKFVFVLTDGQSTSPSITAKEADLLKKSGVTVVAIGIGSNAVSSELESIATDDDHVFQVDDFDALQQIIFSLEATACGFNECGTQKADIVFLLDSSASEGPNNFQAQLEFVQNFTSTFSIGPDGVHVGLVTFSTQPANQFWLNTYENKSDLIDAIGQVPYLAGSTYTDLGLQFVQNQTFSKANGARDDSVPKILVVMTDGQSTDPPATAKMADILHRQGVRVISIGIGQGVVPTELAVIATDRHHMFTVANFSSLKNFQAQLEQATCKSEKPDSECGTKPADIIFVLDSSGSEGSANFQKQLDFMADFVKGFQVGNKHLKFGLVTFSSYARSEFYLDTFDNKASILNKLKQVSYMGSTTHTDSGLQEAYYQLQRYHGARPNAEKIVVVMTDGQSYSPSRTIQKADRVKSTGAKIISIGIGSSISQVELNSIASDRQHVFTVSNFDILKTIELELKDAACGEKKPVQPECGGKNTDIFFLLDSSGSEGKSNFNKMLAFVQNFTRQFEIGPKNVQMGVATFSTNVQPQIKLNQYTDKPALLNAISGIYYDGGLTYTDEGLQYAREKAFLQTNGGRPNASRIVIVMTDGNSYSSSLTTSQANLLKQMPNTKVISIGIGSSVGHRELETIATDAQHVYTVANFDVLNQLNNELTFTACETCGFVQTADIIFALDSSSSEGPLNFQKQLDFVSRFVNDLPVGTNNVQFSVVTFGGTVHNEFYLNQYHQKRPLLDAIQMSHNIGGTTHTADALQFIRLNSILPANGARSNSSQFVIVLTDGASSDENATIHEANALKQTGATTVAIGIGDQVDTKELNAIASDPNHVFSAKNFDSLQTIREEVKKAACDGVNTTMAPPTTTPMPITTTDAPTTTATTELKTTEPKTTTTEMKTTAPTTTATTEMKTTEPTTTTTTTEMKTTESKTTTTEAQTTAPTTTTTETQTTEEVYVFTVESAVGNIIG